jgi:type IX secretion system PorP/SprF family membrane protein
MNSVKGICALLISLWWALSTSAQDLHFSQYYHSGSWLNPALTGFADPDIQAMAVYRKQWASVPVNYETFGAQVQWKPSFSVLGAPLGVGLVLMKDQAGDAALGSTQVAIPIAVHIPLNEQHQLSAGLSAGWSQRGFQPGALTWSSQFVGDVFQPNQPTKQVFEQTRFSRFDLGAGLQYQGKTEGDQFWWTVGAGGWNLAPSNAEFNPQFPVNRFQRYNGYLSGGSKIGSRQQLILHALLQYQGPYQEQLFGLAYRYILVNLPQPVALTLGTGVRFARGTDALIQRMDIEFSGWRLGFSYDFNVSPFKAASLNRGGPELTILYTWTKVKPLPVFKACPIF